MTFQPLLPLWAIVAGFVLLLSGLGWLEMRTKTRWLPARLAALALALLGIAGLLLQPAIDTTNRQRPILLLTKNYQKHKVDSLRQLHPNWQLLRTADAASYPTAGILTDLLDLSVIGQRVQGIFGEGLPASALEYFPEKHFQYFPADLSTGFSYIQSKQYRKGQRNQVQGRYFLQDPPVKLLLKSPSMAEDSVTITPSGEQSFSLSFTPKNEGKWQYELLAKDNNGQLLEQQVLPIEVEKEKQLQVLILQAYPTFEVRYLKDFLVAKGHAVAMRAQISKDRYRTEFANLPEVQLNRLGAGLLEQFDLLLLDGAAYTTLGRTELSALETATQNGLGLLGLLDGDRPAFYKSLGLAKVGAEPDTVGRALPAYPVIAAPNLEWYSPNRSEVRQAAAAYHYRGKGKVGYQATAESFTYLLQGDSLAYAELWMPLLEKTARTTSPAYTLELLNDFPFFTGEPVDFRVVAARELGEVYADSLPVPMLEDYRLEGVWHGRTWPKKAGWHQVQAGDEILNYYAFPEDSWPALATAQKIKHTQASAQTNSAVTIENYQNKVAEPISRIWFYALFLLGAGFLWLTPKL